MDKALVSVKQVGRNFSIGGEEVIALADVSCQVKAGDRIAIMGPSGSGKSTLMALIGQLDEPTFGSVTWPGMDAVGGLRPRHLGLAFQSTSLIPSLSVIENIEMPLLILGEIQNTRSRALAALATVALSGLADRLPEEISGGQAQRVGIARALVTFPQLILADEPTGQLDQATAKLLVQALLAHATKTGAALVIATHDPVVAGQMKSIWHIEHGRLTITQKASAVS